MIKPGFESGQKVNSKKDNQLVVNSRLKQQNQTDNKPTSPHQKLNKLTNTSKDETTSLSSI